MDIFETVNALLNLFVYLEFLLLFLTSTAFTFDVYNKCVGRMYFDEGNIHFLEFILIIHKAFLPVIVLYFLIFKNDIDHFMIYVLLIGIISNIILTFCHLKLITRN